jgi:hypothetical protein
MEVEMNEGKKLVDRMWDVIENKQLERLHELVDADCVTRIPGMELRGVEPLQQMLGAYVVAFPDLKHIVTHHVESEGTLALQLSVTGTHTGPMQMPQGAVPATGKKIAWDDIWIRSAAATCRSVCRPRASRR